MTDIRVIVNGQARSLPAGCTVHQLIESLEMDPARVAVERNLDVVPRAEHGATRLDDGDRVEVVTFVGGGA